MYSTRSLVLKTLLSVLILGTMLSAANAQDVSYKTTSKTELHVLGFLGGLFNGEHKEEVAIKGYKMRMDGKDQSTITDLDGERLININHKKKEYSIVTFAQLSEMMSNLGAKMKEGQAEPKANEEGQSQYDVKFDLQVKDPGKSKKIDGYKTKEKVLILETQFTPKDASADSLPSGAFYAVTDMWLANDVPEMAPASAFQKKAAEVMSENMGSMDMASIINQLMSSYPQVGAAIDRSKEEMTKMDGIPLETTMHMVTVPPDKDLDLALALGEKKEKKKGGGFGGFLKKMAEAKGVGSGDESKPEAEQKTILSVYSVTSDISNKSHDASYFEPPAGYKEVEYESPMKDMEKN